MFEHKKILITGGTGSLGTALTRHLLKTNVDTIRIFSRDEWKQTRMLEEIDDERLRFFIGDIRDKERLARAVEGVDYVIHAAALKQVPIAEYNPFEAIKTNVYGTQNLVEVCLDKNVKKVVAIGTDKAAAPANTYGATKLLMEKIIISANIFKGDHNTSFVCVRYGNVLGSRGSVLPKFFDQIMNKGIITITEPNMTRFTITMQGAIELVLRALKTGKGGELFVPRLKAYTLKDLKDAVLELADKKVKIEKIPLRPGEKFHETLISEDEIFQTYESKEDYIIFQQSIDKLNIFNKPNYKKTNLESAYVSNNTEIVTKDELKKIILQEGLF